MSLAAFVLRAVHNLRAARLARRPALVCVWGHPLEPICEYRR